MKVAQNQEKSQHKSYLVSTRVKCTYKENINIHCQEEFPGIMAKYRKDFS